MRHSREQAQDGALRGSTLRSVPEERTARPRHEPHHWQRAAYMGGAAHPGTETGPLVRPYTMTGGRTRAQGETLDMISIVVATRASVDLGALEPEHATILRLCRAPISVAELSALLDIPMTLVKVLLGDLITKGDVLTREPIPAADLPQMNVLHAVLDGIRRL